MSLWSPSYLLEHWRGEHGLLRSCLFNGLILNFLILGGEIGILALYVVMSGGQLQQPQEYYHSVGLTWEAVWVCVGIWACVGIFRCGVRHARDRTNTNIHRVKGVMAIAWSGAVAIETVLLLYMW